MKKTRDDLRALLFDTFAANLSAYAPDMKDVFGCPICLRILDRSALNHPYAVSLEHCIPKALKGRLYTLTCTECNNRSGEKVEVHLKDLIDSQERFRGAGNKRLPGFLIINNHKITADFHFPEHPRKGISIYMDEGRSNPTEFKRLLESMQEKTRNNDSLEMTLSGSAPYNRLGYRIALLKIGFLMMFRQFGYSYILHPAVQLIREQLLSPEKELIPTVAIDLVDSPPAVNCVSVITSPKEKQGFMVMVRLATKSEVIHKGIFMPGLDKEGCQTYELLRQDELQNNQFSGQCKMVKYEPQWLREPAYVHIVRRIWKDVRGSSTA